VVINFGSDTVDCTHPLLVGTVEVASDGAGEGSSFAAVLGPDQALILRP